MCGPCDLQREERSSSADGSFMCLSSGGVAHLDCAYMVRATEDRELWMCGFSKGQCLIARDEEREKVQRCVNVDKLVNETIICIVQALMVAESDQEETASTDVKFTRQGISCGELRSAGGRATSQKSRR